MPPPEPPADLPHQRHGQHHGQRRRFLREVGATLAAPLAAGVAASAGLPRARAAAPWPQQPLHLLVGFPAGSTPDLVARALADPLALRLGRAVVVENRPGAAGNIATTRVARATDDHTLGVVINGNLTSVQLLQPRPPYDAERDLLPLSLLSVAPLVLVAPASLPSGAAFFEEAKRQGEAWSYGSVGIGSVAHLGMELLKSRLPGFAPMHVPYTGNPPVLQALLGGQIQLALVPPGLALPQVAAGRLRALGLAGARSALAPDVPPLAELGLPDLGLEVWTALVAPARLSTEARTRLTGLVPAILRGELTRERLFKSGWQAVGSSPEGAQRRVAEERKILRQILQSTGARTG